MKLLSALLSVLVLCQATGSQTVIALKLTLSGMPDFVTDSAKSHRKGVEELLAYIIDPRLQEWKKTEGPPLNSITGLERPFVDIRKDALVLGFPELPANMGQMICQASQPHLADLSEKFKFITELLSNLPGCKAAGACVFGKVECLTGELYNPVPPSGALRYTSIGGIEVEYPPGITDAIFDTLKLLIPNYIKKYVPETEREKCLITQITDAEYKVYNGKVFSMIPTDKTCKELNMVIQSLLIDSTVITDVLKGIDENIQVRAIDPQRDTTDAGTTDGTTEDTTDAGTTNGTTEDTTDAGTTDGTTEDDVEKAKDKEKDTENEKEKACAEGADSVACVEATKKHDAATKDLEDAKKKADTTDGTTEGPSSGAFQAGVGFFTVACALFF